MPASNRLGEGILCVTPEVSWNRPDLSRILVSLVCVRILRIDIDDSLTLAQA
jgi:hypothetical protein